MGENEQNRWGGRIGAALMVPTVLALAVLGCSSRPMAVSSVSDSSDRVMTAPPKAQGVPSDRLDLKNWKLTLPIGEPFSPMDVTQPELATFVDDQFFYLSDRGVVFRANSGGVTTPNSSYPRSELREMQNAGQEPASWSTTSGRHTMRYSVAITHLPDAKPHVVAGQLMGSEDDVAMIRLERKHLFVEGGGNNLGTLERDYELGTVFTITIDVSNGRVRIFYNGESTPRVDMKREQEGCYFKLGAYSQSNIERGDSRDAYGEVVVQALAVEHTDE